MKSHSFWLDSFLLHHNGNPYGLMFVFISFQNSHLLSLQIGFFFLPHFFSFFSVILEMPMLHFLKKKLCPMYALHLFLYFPSF